MSATNRLRMAHVSDLHVGSQLDLEDWDRILGSLEGQQVDHLVLSGDITHSNLVTQEEDARQVRALMEEHGYGDASRATVIPGNHDLDGSTGLFLSTRRNTEANLTLFFELFGRYLGEARFPIAKELPGIDLYCFNSIVRRRMRLNLRYALCRRQLDRLRESMRRKSEQLKMLVVHHYPYRIAWQQRRFFGLWEWLEDSLWLRLSGWRRLVSTCVDHGVRYILHGHSHTRHVAGFRGNDLLALGQGTTGALLDFSVYELEAGRVVERVRHCLTPEGIDRESEGLEPQFLVGDWAK